MDKILNVDMRVCVGLPGSPLEGTIEKGKCLGDEYVVIKALGKSAGYAVKVDDILKLFELQAAYSQKRYDDAVAQLRQQTDYARSREGDMCIGCVSNITASKCSACVYGDAYELDVSSLKEIKPNA